VSTWSIIRDLPPCSKAPALISPLFCSLDSSLRAATDGPNPRLLSGTLHLEVIFGTV
jgi:hypothetical protein